MYSLLILVFLFWFTTIHLKWFTQRECVKVTFLKFLVLRERTIVIAYFPEHLIYSNFEMFNILTPGFLLWFDFPEQRVCSNFKKSWFWFPTIHPKCFYNSHLFLKFYVLSERSSDIASFVQNPVNSRLKIYSDLILVLFILFWHVWTKLNESFFLETLGAPRKEQWYCFFHGALGV